jgi:dihydrofolate reductase
MGKVILQMMMVYHLMASLKDQTKNWIDTLWMKNLTKVKENITTEEITKLKQQPSKDLVLFGDVCIAQTLVSLGLIDEYQIIVNPVVLGNGKPLFKDLNDKPSYLT